MRNAVFPRIAGFNQLYDSAAAAVHVNICDIHYLGNGTVAKWEFNAPPLVSHNAI
jgi:hypothetical protein